MPKKKVKKKVKKAAKRSKKATSKATSGRKPAKRRINPQLLLLAKIARITERVPRIEPTGEEIDDQTGEVLFRYTEAQHVFKVYREQCEMEKIRWRSYVDKDIQPSGFPVGNMPLIFGCYCIEDLETGERIIGWGSGMGRNRDWSGNTAGTRTEKQFLLNTFEATWEDPDKPIKKREELKQEVMSELAADGTLDQIELAKFYAEQLNRGVGPETIQAIIDKEKQNGTSSGKENPNGDNKGGDGKGDRKGKKRDNSASKRASRKRLQKR